MYIAGGGHAHFPLSALIAGADNMKLAPAFHPHFHWINDSDIISDFRKVKPWTNIVRILEGIVTATLIVIHLSLYPFQHSLTHPHSPSSSSHTLSRCIVFTDTPSLICMKVQ